MIKIGEKFYCKKSLKDFYTKGKEYLSFKTNTIRDNFGFDYDFLFVDRYFIKTSNNE